MKRSRYHGLSISMAMLVAAGTLPADAFAKPAAVAKRTPAVHALSVPVVHYLTATVDRVKIAYVEAGLKDGPVVLLLQGFPTSSHQFRNLIPLLADRYRVIAPDYPGFGESDAPPHDQFEYSFAHYATLIDGLVSQLGAKRYAIYLFDYGAPVGFRLALKHPERVSATIVQNGNADAEGLGVFWGAMKADWANPTPATRETLSSLVTFADHHVSVPGRDGGLFAHRSGELAP